jgi:hypothetical protein
VRPRAGRPGDRSVRRWRLGAIAAALVTLVALTGTVPPAGAQELGDDDVDVRLVVSSLTGVLGPSSLVLGEVDPLDRPEPPLDLEVRLLVENAGPSPLDSLRLVLELFPAAGTRADLTAALEGEPTGQPHVHEVAVHDGAPLETGAIAGIADTFEHEEVAIWAEDGGVHPLRLTVQRGTDVLAQTTTAVVWMGRAPTSPLLTSVVWPIDDGPWRTAQGAYLAGADRTIQPGGRLDTLLRVLERRPEAHVVLAPAAHLLEDLRDRADGFTILERQADGSIEARTVEPEDRDARLANDTLTRLRELAQQLPLAPVTGAYADADLAALMDTGLTELAAESAVEGRRRLQLLLDRAPDAGTHLAGGRLSPAVLDLLPGDQVLLPADAAAPDPDLADRSRGALRPLRSASGRLLTALIADPQTSAALEAAPSPAGPVADAQRVLAESAAAYFEAPETPDRIHVVLPPASWSASPELLTRLLDGFSDAPWVALTSPDAQATRGDRSERPMLLAEPVEGPLAAPLASSLQDATAALTAARTALTAETPTIGDRSPRDLHDALLRATSRWYLESGAGESDALVRDVRRAVDETFGDVAVASGTQVTLTSDSGQIPITLQRTRGGPITVRVEVASQGRLVWPDGRRSEPLELTDGATQTVSFHTRALSTGTFPVTVRITDPSGEHELERTTLSVRSTAISGPALSATGLAVLALLLAGALRRRRPRRQRLEVVE